jgi:hypothetical protein
VFVFARSIAAIVASPACHRPFANWQGLLLRQQPCHGPLVKLLPRGLYPHRHHRKLRQRVRRDVVDMASYRGAASGHGAGAGARVRSCMRRRPPSRRRLGPAPAGGGGRTPGPLTNHAG